MLNDSKDGGISLRGVANPDSTVNNISDIEIYGNIVSSCHGSYPYAFFIGSDKIVNIEDLRSDNNLFFPSPATKTTQPLISYKGKKYRASQFRDYQRDTGHDRHSLEANPMFKDEANDDYRLSPDSPAIKSGRNLQESAPSKIKLPGEQPNIGAL